MLLSAESMLIRRSYVAASAIATMQAGGSVGEILKDVGMTWGNPRGLVRLTGTRTIRGGCMIPLQEGPYLFLYMGVSAGTTTAFISGYLNQHLMASSYGFNTASYNDAVNAGLNQWAAEEPANRQVYLYGHSAGGVVAEALAGIMGNLRVGDPQEIVTFGTPKPALRGSTWHGVNTVRARWMNNRDPTPCIPWGASTTGNAIALVTYGSDYNPTAVDHGTGGRAINGDRYSFRDDNFPPSQLPRIGDYVDWMVGVDDHLGYPHSINTYRDNLERIALRTLDEGGEEIVAETGPRLIPDLVIDRPNLAPEIALREMDIVHARGDAVVSRLGDVIPGRWTWGSKMPQSKLSSDVTVKRVRLGNSWAVVWQDFVIAYTASPSAARSIASSMNRTLRMLGKTSSVSETAYLNFVQAYLGLAGAGNGVRPPLNVVA